MATSVWKGYLTFGLISIPIRLFSAARSERISLNQLHKVCNSRIKMPLFCPTCDRKVERSEIVKGYEYEKDQYVLFTDEELDKIEPDSGRTMEILEFVKVEEIDPLYYDASYYVTPEDEGKKAYQLLLDAAHDVLSKRDPRGFRVWPQEQRGAEGSGEKAGDATDRKPGCKIRAAEVS
jgi:DNA end-binding protein Ku